MYPNNGNTGQEGKHGVWRFVRGDDYPDDTKYKRSYLPGFTGGARYSGLTVDKFGRVFVFREEASAEESILNKIKYIQAKVALDQDFITTDIDDTRGDGCCAGKHKIEGSPLGWVYAISDNGDEGWIQYYNVQNQKVVHGLQVGKYLR